VSGEFQETTRKLERQVLADTVEKLVVEAVIIVAILSMRAF
jgi:hypothetical protein